MKKIYPGIDGILLAAGFSSRAGLFKMTLPLGKKTILECALQGMLEVCQRVTVVGGHRVDTIRELLKNYPRVKLVFNENYRNGMFTSVQTGVGQVEGEAFFLMPGDYPMVPAEVYHALIEEMKSGTTSRQVFIPTYEGSKGHPVLMKASLKEKILNEPSESNLRDVIRREGFQPVPVAHKGILVDIDTMEDYHSVLRT